MTQNQCWKTLCPLFKELLATESFNQLRTSGRHVCVSVCVSWFITVYSPAWWSLLSSVPVLLTGIQTAPFCPPSASPPERTHGKEGMMCFFTVKSSSHCSDCAECSEGVGLKQLRLLSASESHVSPVMLLRAKRQSTINPKLRTLLHNSAVTNQQFVKLSLAV